MPLANLGSKHLTAAQKTTIDNALKAIATELNTVSPNLTDDDRKKYGSINEQNKLMVNKVTDFHKVQPALQSPDVDWAEHDLDYDDRYFADSRMETLATLTRQLSDFKMVHDYDNFKNALTDYAYSQYKAGTNTPGYTEKVNTLKQFFPRTSGDKPDTETPKE